MEVCRESVFGWVHELRVFLFVSLVPRDLLSSFYSSTLCIGGT
jgi:hypothetical protein